MTAIVAALCALAAFLLFGFATDRHHELRFGHRLTRRHARWYRSTAWAAIAACLFASIGAWGAVFGPVAWVGLIMAGASGSFLLLNLVPEGPARRSSHSASKRSTINRSGAVIPTGTPVCVPGE